MLIYILEVEFEMEVFDKRANHLKVERMINPFFMCA